jgi:hypothetical protein
VRELRPALPLLRNVGGPGSGAIFGQPPQFNGPLWLAAAPWSNTTVLVPDSGNGRVVEVDVVTGTLVRVWVSAIGQPRGVAASPSAIAVSQENATSSRVLVYSVATGALLVAIGGAPLAPGNSCCVGVHLGQPSGLRLSQDGATIDVAETGAGRVTRWRVADGAYLGTVGSGYAGPADVQQCYSAGAGAGAGGSSVGVVVASSTGSRLDVSVDGVVTSTGGLGSAVSGVSLVAGVGVLVVMQSPPGLMLLSSVALEAQSGNTSMALGSSITLSVSVSGAASGLTYVWTRNGSVVGGNSSSCVLASNGSDGGAVYALQCTVTHALGRVVSSMTYVAVKAQVDGGSYSTYALPHVHLVDSRLCPACSLAALAPFYETVAVTPPVLHSNVLLLRCAVFSHCHLVLCSRCVLRACGGS